MLLKELETMREQDYAVNREEIKDIRAVGAPVLVPDDEGLSPVGISGPVHRMETPEYEERMVGVMTDTPSRIQLSFDTAATGGEFPDPEP